MVRTAGPPLLPGDDGACAISVDDHLGSIGLFEVDSAMAPLGAREGLDLRGLARMWRGVLKNDVAAAQATSGGSRWSRRTRIQQQHDHPGREAHEVEKFHEDVRKAETS